MSTRIITETKVLEDFCDGLLSSAKDAVSPIPLSMDTEFIRELYYYPKVCLIQMALDPECPVLVDPLGDIDLSPLKKVLTSPRVLKIFHAAHHDLEVFYHELRVLPEPVFDTQIAAMACVSQKRESYDKLVKRLCKCTLDKSQQVSQWDQRPLTPQQIQYATSDVTHLLTLYKSLSQHLEKTARRQWVEQEMETLFQKKHFLFQPDAFWLTLSPPKTDMRSLKLFRALVTWREHQAEQKNVPRSFVLRKQDINALVLYPITSLEDAKKSRVFPKGLIRRIEKIGKPFWTMLEKARASSEPLPPKESRKTQKINKLQLTLTQSLLEEYCKEENIAPELLAKKDDIIAFLTDAPHEKCRLLQGWREPFGRKMMALKEGKIIFMMENGRIKIKESPSRGMAS